MYRRFSRWLPPITFLLFVIFVFWLWATQKANNLPTDRWYQYNPFAWPRRVENFDFHNTLEEQLCFNGSILRINSPDATFTIPRIVHITWGLKGDGTFTLALYLSIKSALVNIRPNQIQVHYTRLDEDNEYFQALKPHLTLVHHDPADMASGVQPNWHVAHMSDVMRLRALYDTGGIYMDSDVYILRSFDALLAGARDVVLGHEGGNRYGLCNALIVAKKGAPFVQRWLEHYDDFTEQDWNYHSVVLPRKLADEHPEELCALSPTTFFWPLWTPSHVDYMHAELDEDQARKVEAEVERNGGGLYANQLAYHAWSQNSYELYVGKLTPEIIRTRDTRFNILVRRFLD